jgi:hypothetical protein
MGLAASLDNHDCCCFDINNEPNGFAGVSRIDLTLKWNRLLATEAGEQHAVFRSGQLP